MAEWEEEIATAIAHGASVVLMALKNAGGQGYTTLEPFGEPVSNGVNVAKAEAAARGVPDDAIAANITNQHIHDTAQKMGAASVDPAVVATETKAEGVPPLTEADTAKAEDTEPPLSEAPPPTIPEPEATTPPPPAATKT